MYINLLYKSLITIYHYISNSLYNTLFKIQLYLNNVEFGDNLHTYNAIPDLQISKDASKVLIGDNVSFNNYAGFSWYCKCKIIVRPNAFFEIGNNSGGNGVMIFCSEKIIIGNYVNIGGGTAISDSNHHSLDWIARRNHKTKTEAKTSPIIIEDDVFIGAGCIIGKGVKIGARSIIAAGSVVVKDVPEDCIAGGNPCKILKSNINGICQ